MEKGQGSPLILLHGARDLNERIPSSKVLIIPGAGHLVHREVPERFDDEVREFLRSVS